MNYRNWICSAVLGTFVVGGSASAQAPAAPAAPAAAPAAAKPEAPRPSPAAKVQQRVGLTDITVDYFSPAVKKRKIWGELVPQDKLWRTGANGSTKLTFSKDVVVADKPVPAGTYALLTIPGKKEWTVVLNKNTGLGGNMDKHSEAEDVAKFTVKPKSNPHRERMTFIFSDFTDDSTSLDLEWEKVKVSLPIKAAAK